MDTSKHGSERTPRFEALGFPARSLRYQPPGLDAAQQELYDAISETRSKARRKRACGPSVGTNMIDSGRFDGYLQN